MVDSEDPILGHGAVAMSNRYLRLSLDNPDDSAILPFLRADVFLKHRLGGFVQLVTLMYQNLDRYCLRKMSNQLNDYLPALRSGTNIHRLQTCVETLLKYWIKESVSVDGVPEKSVITLSESRAMMRNDSVWLCVTSSESWYLTVIFAMLANSEALWYVYP